MSNNNLCATQSIPEDLLEDESTLYSLSKEYSEAALILINMHPSKIGYQSVIYNLLGHAAELALKSYLFKSGECINSLQKVGHNLDRLIQLAEKKGLVRNGLKSILEISLVYKEKRLDYRIKKQISLPDRDDLLKEVCALQQTVYSHITIELYGDTKWAS